MIGSGTFKVKVDGEEVGLRFGMLSTHYTEELSGKTIYQIFKEIATGRSTPMLLYFQGGMTAFNHYAKNKKEVDILDAANLIEQNPEEAIRIYTESIRIHTDPEAEKKEAGEPAAA